MTDAAAPEFTHRLNFTGYQRIVLDMLAGEPNRVLDIPAGGGQMAEALRAQGHEVVAADINRHDDSFTFADMTRRLPFEDESFDAVICLEGIEHVLNPHDLIGELFRVCRVGGRVIVTTPNVQNMFSRVQWLFTGTQHMFHFSQLRDLPPGAEDDRFHVSPVCLGRLWYEATYWGARPARVSGDRIKKKMLLPLYALVWAIGWWWTRSLLIGKGRPEHADRNAALHRASRSPRVMLGRSLVFEAIKERHVVEAPAAEPGP
jgi:SAM-dependent methyltransferase